MDLMSFSWAELFSIALIHFFAVASPGPDFAIVLKQALNQGRLAAIFTSLGIGFGILLHVTYSLVGIGIIIQTTPWLLSILLYVAAGYLIWIGVGALRSKANTSALTTASNTSKKSLLKSFGIGFLTNGLNPKATLFFLSLFTVAIAVETPTTHKIVYGLYMAVATALWFIAVSVTVTHSKVRVFYQQKGYLFDRAMGVVLIGMAILLLLT
ncbi:LysE family transporter [Glaciecola sp. MH2013]|uniref:LysE family translocator n=1 Tax=Glaciecola sp. MH2013 TaxID=2785524 RepID=UPI00189D986D|nr:LysE family transporter [Glaciecola sp. MH2013]MBF7072840.1 LysE family transporter [Glaciecola sp. MH2013]